MFPIFVFLWNEIFILTGLYDVFTWLGMPMHFIGGISIAYFSFYTINYLQEEKYLRLNKFLLFVFVISLVSLFAVLWESYEFLVDIIFGFNYQPSLEDTMADLFIGLAGGMTAILILLKKQ